MSESILIGQLSSVFEFEYRGFDLRRLRRFAALRFILNVQFLLPLSTEY